MASFTLSEMSFYRNNYSPAMHDAVQKTDSIFGEFLSESKNHNFRLLILDIPSKVAVLRSFKETALYEIDTRSRDYALETIRQGYAFEKPDSIVQSLSEKHHIHYISLLSTFRKKTELSPFYRIDTHWRTVGEKIAADTLIKAFKQLE